ncbi:hypothetical protein AGLY_003752 [Aphis glycines]|uniref:Uncharacterized protein n=1 Tax=Aphis glycines TaxID=307491 RepID=A0A6G0TZL2_APHGL|nr:hypothetical protein AGLY_003752 [Aphis glycines]
MLKTWCCNLLTIISTIINLQDYHVLFAESLIFVLSNNLYINTNRFVFLYSLLITKLSITKQLLQSDMMTFDNNYLILQKSIFFTSLNYINLLKTTFSHPTPSYFNIALLKKQYKNIDLTNISKILFNYNTIFFYNVRRLKFKKDIHFFYYTSISTTVSSKILILLNKYNYKTHTYCDVLKKKYKHNICMTYHTQLNLESDLYLVSEHLTFLPCIKYHDIMDIDPKAIYADIHHGNNDCI